MVNHVSRCVLNAASSHGYYRIHKLAIGISAVILLILFTTVSVANAVLEEQTPNSFKEALRLGILSFQNDDLLTATAYFSQAIQLNSHSGAAYTNRCLVYLELKDYQSAITDCTQALQLNPKNAEALLNRGLARYRSTEYAESIADYNQLLAFKPDDYRAYYNRGLAQIEQGAYQEAIDDFGEALHQTSPLERHILSDIYRDRGLTRLMLSQPQPAIEDFSQSIRLNHTNVGAFYNRGCAYHEQGNYLAAIQDFNQVLQQAPEYAQAYLSRGIVRHELGERAKAIADLQQAAQYFYDRGLIHSYQQTLSLIDRLSLPGSILG